MKINDFFDNLNVFFRGDEEVVENAEDLEESAQIYAYAYKNEVGEIIEIRIFNPEYRQILAIDKKGNVEPLSLEDV